MHRLIIITMLVVATVVHTSAQRHYSPNLSIGGKAGATLSMMSFSPKVSQKMLAGAMGGVVVRYTEEKLFGIIAELNVEQRGWSEKYENGEPFNYSRTLTYLQIPLLTHIRFGSDRVKGFVNLGPEVGYMRGSSISANFNWHDVQSVEGYPQRYRTNRIIAYSICGRKIRYRRTDVEQFHERWIRETPDKLVDRMIEAYPLHQCKSRSYGKKRGNTGKNR